MFNAVYPVGKKPLVVRTNTDYKYTSVAVDQVMAADGNYQVLFLGTGMDQPVLKSQSQFEKFLGSQMMDFILFRYMLTGFYCFAFQCSCEFISQIKYSVPDEIYSQSI